MINVVQGDITKISVDAIVNAANSSLLGGGGVDGAIHRAGGPDILAECIKIRDRQGGCDVGEAVITAAGKLPAKFVIHTVGPIWSGGLKNEDKLLENAYLNSLKLAEENGVQSIAFPSISTGVYRFPKDRAAKIAVEVATNFLALSHTIKDIVFVCFDEETFNIYEPFISKS